MTATQTPVTHSITREHEGGWHSARCSCGACSHLTTKGQVTAWINRHLSPAEHAAR